MSIASFSGLASGIQWRDMIDQIMKLEARPVDTLRSRIKALDARVSAWGAFKSRVQTLAETAKSLGKGEAFNSMRTAVEGLPSGAQAPFSLSTTEGAAPGRYNVRVIQLATAEKLGSGNFESARAALGLAGEFLVNGVRIQLEERDALDDVARRINAANTGSARSGVSAAVLAAGDGGVRLVLTSERTGSAGIDLVDGEGGVLEALGILGTTTAPRHPGTDAVLSDAFTRATAPLADLRPFANASGGSVTLGPPNYSFAVTIDPATDSLEDVAASINAAAEEAGSAIRARVVPETGGGETRYRLEIAGTSDFEDSNGILESLGVLGRAPARRITAGQDAIVVIDGDRFTRASNTIADIVPGVTLTLTAADPDLELSAVVTRDTDAVVNSLQALVKGYNDIADFVTQQGTVTGTARQPLNGDSVLRGMRDQLRAALQTELLDDGTGAPRRLSEIGITIGRDGRFSLDNETLRKALESDPAAVQRLLGQDDDESGAARGIGRVVSGLAQQMLGAEGGSITSITVRLQEQARGIDRQAIRIEDRLEVRREQMEKRFIAMEQAIARANSQSDWLLSQINALTAASGR